MAYQSGAEPLLERHSLALVEQIQGSVARRILGSSSTPRMATPAAVYVPLFRNTQGSGPLTDVTKPQTEPEIESIRRSLLRGTPDGSDNWITQSAVRLQLKRTLHSRGRPRKK